MDDIKKQRYENILQSIREKESKLKRTQTQLKKLYKRKKYYERLKNED